MVFYNNRVSIADVKGKEIYVIRNIKNDLVLNYYSLDGKIVEKILADNLLEEFDLFIDGDNSIYLIYQSIDNNLNKITIGGSDTNTYKLTREGFPKIFELNLIKHNDDISMIFLYPINNSHKIFQIEHSTLKDDKWTSILVDQVRVSQVLNPIKVIYTNGTIFLAYYYEDQICLRSYNEKEGQWKESIVLTDNKEKLYLDLIYDDGYFHLVYSQAIDGNYIIKYKMFEYRTRLVEKHIVDISRKSNSSNPTIIMNDGLMWIIWNESSRIYSRVSKDKGRTWSEIKAWNESVKHDIVRYKYTSNMEIKDRIIHNTFGTIHPDIKFVGFE